MARRVLLLLGGIAACHHAPPHKPGDEYLAAIKFEGNHDKKDAWLLTGLELHRALNAGRAPDPYQVQLDADRLRGEYARTGYFEMDVQARVERAQDAATVTYAIQEGTRAKTHITITGLPDDVAQRVRAKLPLHDGSPFDYDAYDQAKGAMLGAVQDAGYAHAKLDGHIDGDIATHTAFLDLAFDTGPKCKFGSVQIQGVDGDLRDAIVSRLQFHAGDPYSTHAIAATQRAIYGMGRFSTVQVQPDPGQSEVVDVKVAVAEGAAHQLTFGGGFGIDPISYEVRGRAGYEVTGWPFPLDRFTIDLRPAYAYLRDGSGYQPRIRALMRLERLDLFQTYAIGSVELGYDYLAYEAYTEYGPRAQLGYEMRLGSRHLKLRGDYLIHQYGFRNPSPLIDDALQMQIGIDHTERVGAFDQALIADFRDHPLEPTSGVYGEMRVTEGGPWAGGQYAFEKISPELRGYVPVGPVVLAARARYGAIFGQVPPSERFFAGGATSNRGFSERLLAPSLTGPVNGTTITVPYGGAGLLDGSVEARFPITEIRKLPLGGLVFVDAADVEERPGELDASRLIYSVGPGLRLTTPVGPVRADFGWRLNRTGPMDPEPGARYAFHLSLGEAF